MCAHQPDQWACTYLFIGPQTDSRTSISCIIKFIIQMCFHLPNLMFTTSGPRCLGTRRTAALHYNTRYWECLLSSDLKVWKYKQFWKTEFMSKTGDMPALSIWSKQINPSNAGAVCFISHQLYRALADRSLNSFHHMCTKQLVLSSLCRPIISNAFRSRIFANKPQTKTKPYLNLSGLEARKTKTLYQIWISHIKVVSLH